MLKNMPMCNLIFTALFSMTSLITSCAGDENRELPVQFVRYEKDNSIQSNILNSSVKYSIYLPEGYKENLEQTYSVVYLLHGYGDDNNSWNDESLDVTGVIMMLEKAGRISPMIYVLPQGFNSYYVNRYTGRYNYMDMFIKELVPHIDSVYRTKADREHRAVVGYSMGGFGAMVLPSLNPDVFSVSVPLSMSFRTDAQYMTEPADGWNNQWGNIFGGYGMQGEARLTDYYKSHCPLHFFTKENASYYSDVHYFLDCGDDEEQLSVGNDELHMLMREVGISHEYRVRDGAHTSSYWRSGMKEVLPFIESCFKGEAYIEEDTLTINTTFSGSFERKTICGVEASFFLPAGYDAKSASSYNVVYLAHDGLDLNNEKAIISILDEVQKSTPFIMVLFDHKKLVGKTFLDWAKNVEVTLSVEGGTGKRIGIGNTDGGRFLFEASCGSTTIMKSLYLFDAAIDGLIMTPNVNTSYYIDITDMGKNYRGANALYLKCRESGIDHEYRVRNGLDSTHSLLTGLRNIKTSLLKKLNN